jgi:GTP-binding protein
MGKTKAPIVAIVGRANVGKSSFFNAVLRKREAITAEEPGTTRDSIMAKAIANGKPFWLVDTAGIKDPEDDFELTIQDQIAQAASDADIIIVMIDATVAVNDEDRRLSKMALKTKKPVILLANKIDQVKPAYRTGRNPDIEQYKKFGIKQIFLTSTTQFKGIDEALNCLAGIMPKTSIKESSNTISLALLGRPNVGKSALFNALAKKQQAIVAERAGTTRDINRQTVKYKGKSIQLLDTAGIRRSGKIQRGVEKFSVLRSLSAIEQSDVCLMLIDVNELATQLDQKIAGMIKEAGKGLVLIVSKWDAAEGKDEFTRDKITPQIQHNFAFVPWAPLIFTSSETGQNVTKIFDLVLDTMDKRATRIKTPELNKWLAGVAAKHPPAGLKNKTPKLRYMVQEDDNPTPTFKIYGSDTRLLHWSYKRFMERELRTEFGFGGTPIKFWFFDRK